MAQQEPIVLPDINVTASRLGGTGIVGTSTTVITAEEIERSPGLSIIDILGREAGIQTTNLWGTANGAGGQVDMRGFGVNAPSNTLVLINGRRLNDWDLAGIDFASIARNAIDRIEITRGNSGAVLYGDGAVGGVINIVTKSGANLPPSVRVEGGFGSFGHKQTMLSASQSSGGWSASAHGDGVESDGYRRNNRFWQRTAVGDVRYSSAEGSAFLNIGGDTQRLGLPGTRNINTVTGLNQYITSPRGTNSPFDHGDKTGWNITTGFTRKFGPVELIVDAGIREKQTLSSFFGSISAPFPFFLDSSLSARSLTPRLNIDTVVGGLSVKVLTGVDIYDTDYGSDRAQLAGLVPYHRYSLNQVTVGGYWQQTVGVLSTTDVSFGYRVQQNAFRARDMFNPAAPGAGFQPPQGLPLDKSEVQQAAHIGFDHRINSNVAMFGRMARSFRVPNVDERVGAAPFTFPATPTNFDVRTQTSYDVEAGMRLTGSRWSFQTSAYDMRLRNELRFDPITFANVNLDPTHRWGVEAIGTLQVTDAMRMKGSLTYTRAKFTSGPFAGNDVPSVAHWSGSLTTSFDILPKRLVADAVVRYVSSRRLDSDDAHTATFIIPAVTLVDLRVGGETERLFWSLAVQNVFDKKHLQFGAAFTPTFYGVYPLPGRTFLVRAGVKLL